jgi:hypothetical protein
MNKDKLTPRSYVATDNEVITVPNKDKHYSANYNMFEALCYKLEGHGLDSQ